MKKIRIGCCLLAAGSILGCTTMGSQEEVSYHDRNDDGTVDLEKHHYRRMADSDWQLQDDNYDRRFEKKVLFGFALTEEVIDIPVPKGVPIRREPQ